MKALLLSTALAAGFALPASAQDSAMSPFQMEATGPAVAASDVIGARIYVTETALEADNYAGVQDGWEDIGEVNDIILGRDGVIDAVLVDIGGFLGVGERQVAVDMSALKIIQDDATDVDDWFLVLQTDRATLDAAPEWTTSAELTDNGETVPAADADGLESDDVADADPAPGTMEDPAAAETMTADPLTAETSEPMAADPLTEQSTEAMTNDAATEGISPTFPEGYAALDKDKVSAELLTGAKVYDNSQAVIAEVSDLILTADGQVTDIVLDVGGFLGLGTKAVAVPLDRLNVAQDDTGAVMAWLNMTKEELEALPDHTM